MKQILFVCTGNTCRSSMAEVIANHLARQKGWGDKLVFLSAGTHAFPGSPASYNAVEAVKTYDLDLTSHAAKRVTQDLINRADLVLTMTRGHKMLLAAQFPASLGKLYTLHEYLGDEFRDVADPIGGDLAVYQACAEELEGAVKELLRIIQAEREAYKK